MNIQRYWYCLYDFYVFTFFWNGLNKLIQDHGGLAVVQSANVRWISLISLLESIKISYKQVKKVLVEKKQSFVLNKMIISQLILILKPFKHVLVII